MFGKNILFLTILSFNSALIGMNNEKLLAAIPCNQQISVIDLESGKKIGYLNFPHEITAISLNHSDKQLAILSQSEISIFQTPDNNKKLKCKKINSFQHKEKINSIYFDENNNVRGIDINDAHQLRTTDLKTNTEINTLNHNSWVTICAISRSEKLCVTGSGNNKAHLFDLKEKKESASFDLNSPVNTFAFNESETLLAIASRDKKIHIFDLSSYTETKILDHNEQILSICFKPSILETSKEYK